MSLQLIPDDDALLIRAAVSFRGVDDAVRELIDNSITAGASEISVTVHSCNGFSVWDNGSGIDDEFTHLGEEGWTSKTDGRGKSLAHLIALSSEVNVSSRGMQKTMGSVSSRNTTETQVIGTLISVQGFLEKIPVRGKCLTSSKSPYTKTLVQVRTALTAVYLCNRLLTVKLIDDNNEVRSLFPGVSEHLSQQEGIEQAWRTLFSQDSRMTLAGNELINESTNNINISGYWSNTAESLTKSRQYLSVNGKPSKCGLVSHVINTLYKRACKGNDVKRYSLRGRRYPSFFVEISCNPEHVDVIPAGGLFNTSFKYSQGIAILLMRIVTHVLEINRHTVPTCLGLYQGMWLSINKEGNQNIESDDMSLSEPEIPISRDGSSQLEPEVDIHTSTQLLPKFVDEEERGHESISSSAVFRSIPILRKQLRPVKIVPPKPLSLEMIPLTCEKIDSPASDTTVVVEYETASSGSTDDDIIQLDDVIDDSDNDFLPADISRSSLPEEGSHQLVDEIVSRSSAPSILAGCSFDDDIFGIESLSSPIPRGWNRTPFSDSCTSRESLPCGRDKVVELPKASSDSQVVLQKTCAPESKSSSKLVKRQKVEAAEALDSNSDSIVVNDFRTERCILKGSSVPLVDPPTTVRQTGVIIGNPFKSRLLEKRKASLVQSNPERNASLLKSVPSVDQETCPLSTAVLLKRRKYEQTQPDEECLDDGNKIPKTEIQPTEVTDTSAETAIDNELEKSQKELSQAQIATYAPNIWRRWYDGKTTVASKTGQLLKHVTVRKEDLTSNNFHVVGQACNQFVICFNGSTNQLYAVDQHAADERVKLEILLSSVGELIKSKKQLSAITIQATDSELIAVIQSTEELQRYGWEFTIEESSVTFFSVPEIHFPEWVAQPRVVLIDAAAALQAALEIKSSGGGSLLLPSVITRLLASKSCRSAIMFGDALDNVSCETLISSLTSSLDPFHCAHGRPAIAPLSTPPVIPQHTKPSFCNLMARKKPFLARLMG